MSEVLQYQMTAWFGPEYDETSNRGVLTVEAYSDWNKLFERIGQRYTTLYPVKVLARTRKTPKEVN
jgi:hypothetical protein